jgi:hypothetical protein
LKQTVSEAVTQVQSTYESALNFHETLNSLAADETFDIGLYRPILITNGERLASVKGKVGQFQVEFNRVSDELGKIMRDIDEECAKRSPRLGGARPEFFRKWPMQVLSSLRRRGSPERSAPVYEAWIKMLFATNRLVYDVVIASDLVI